MATRTLPTGLVLRPIRVFRLHYFCPRCESEWCDEALVVSSGYSPCCDEAAEPYCTEEFTENRPEFDLPEAA